MAAAFGSLAHEEAVGADGPHAPTLAASVAAHSSPACVMAASTDGPRSPVLAASVAAHSSPACVMAAGADGSRSPVLAASVAVHSSSACVMAGSTVPRAVGNGSHAPAAAASATRYAQQRDASQPDSEHSAKGRLQMLRETDAAAEQQRDRSQGLISQRLDSGSRQTTAGQLQQGVLAATAGGSDAAICPISCPRVQLWRGVAQARLHRPTGRQAAIARPRWRPLTRRVVSACLKCRKGCSPTPVDQRMADRAGQAHGRPEATMGLYRRAQMGPRVISSMCLMGASSHGSSWMSC